jgi:hypothetical protein
MHGRAPSNQMSAQPSPVTMHVTLPHDRVPQVPYPESFVHLTTHLPIGMDTLRSSAVLSCR